MFGFCWPHKWEKWGEPFTVRVPERRVSEKYVINEHHIFKQKRVCSRCGKVQEAIIETK